MRLDSGELESSLDRAAELEAALLADPDAAARALARIREQQPKLYTRIAPSYLDTQTGLYAKYYFEQELLPKALAEADRTCGQLSYAIIDIDDLKAINDSAGHSAGDRIILSFVDFLEQNFRAEGSKRLQDYIGKLSEELPPASRDYIKDKGHSIGRVGTGDEFGLILQNCDLHSALTALERLRRKIASTTFSGYKISVSIGVAEHQRGCDAKSLIERADAALIEAKKAGKAQVRASLKF